MNFTQKVMFCDICNSEMIVKKNGNTLGIYCPNCDRALVSSDMPKILFDENDYKIIIIKGDPKDKYQISLISKLGNINFLTARKLLTDKPFVLFTGGASEVLEIRNALNNSKIEYSIDPKFPW